jgi:hypothetical protein
MHFVTDMLSITAPKRQDGLVIPSSLHAIDNDKVLRADMGRVGHVASIGRSRAFAYRDLAHFIGQSLGVEFNTGWIIRGAGSVER